MDEGYLTVEGLTKSFGETVALDDVSLGVAEGERIALLGPSGCGKTTLLRVVSGLETPDRGRIAIWGETLVGPGVFMPAETRRVGLVFQDWALFPHLTVARNVAYGLTREEVSAGRVEATLEMVDLGHLTDRYPHQLSAGQAQRVALARALAPRPRVLLFDEPFSNLDTELRVKVRSDVAGLMREVGMTSIFVTHDQEEAFVLGDRVAVMRQGRIVQVGSPSEIYETPATPWVAGFVGEANLIEGVGSGSVVSTALGDLGLAVDRWGQCRVVVRPEHLTVTAGDDGLVFGVEFYGHDTSYQVSIEDRRLLVREMATPRFVPGDRVSVAYSGPDVTAFAPSEAEVFEDAAALSG